MLRGNTEILITSIPIEIEHFIWELNCALLLRFQVLVTFYDQDRILHFTKDDVRENEQLKLNKLHAMLEEGKKRQD